MKIEMLRGEIATTKAYHRGFSTRLARTSDRAKRAALIHERALIENCLRDLGFTLAAYEAERARDEAEAAWEQATERANR